MKDIVVGVKINKDGAVKGVKDINSELGKVEDAGKKASKGMGGFTDSLKKNKLAITASVTGLGLLLGKLAKESIALAEVQIKAEAKLAATIKATGGAAGLTANQLKTMASGLQSVTTVGDEAILGAQALLLTFKNIGGNIFPRVTEAVLDMSEAMGQDLKSSSIQLGKALNDPIAGVAALTRIGVQFTDTQKDQIKLMQESNNLLGAQDIILKEVESQFGGVARAMAETDIGKIQQMKNELGDIQEQIGTGLIPAQLWWNKSILDAVHFWGQLSTAALRFLGIDKTTLTKMERYNSLIDGARDRIEIWGDAIKDAESEKSDFCLLYTSPSPRDGLLSRMPSSA